MDVRWIGLTLLLVATNDYDDDGEAIANEFSDTDTVAAYAPGMPGYRVASRLGRRESILTAGWRSSHVFHIVNEVPIGVAGLNSIFVSPPLRTL